MATYLIATKSETDAKKARRFYERHGIPCWIGKNKSTFVLFTIDETMAYMAKQLKYCQFARIVTGDQDSKGG
ncbi:hypothetical protein [Alicyclobacillus kakegawensis]|uniref:hypothetical protein n=1 Tax=Alicyclobacillus kakegawensis TaxID=392012 RepID=UPI0008377006|nr:hypothetical protein [Alicyclobacillus kakegawensis]